MLEAKLTIEAPELADAIMALAHAFGSKAGGYTPEATTGRKRRAAKSEAPASHLTPISTAAPSETPAAIPGTAAPGVTPDGTWEAGGNAAVEEPAPVVTAAPAVAPSAAPEKPSFEAVAGAGAALCEQGKTNELMSLLNSYGVQTVTQAYNMDGTAFANFLAGLRALGAQV